MNRPAERVYWRRQLRLTLILLAIWFAVGPGAGILLVEPLNRFTLGGMPLGFWIAQQGAIYVFVALIFVFAWLSDRNARALNGAGRHGDGPAISESADA